MKVAALGKHTLLDFYECDRDTLAHVDRVREILCEAARQGKATIVEEVFHQFNPHGTSGGRDDAQWRLDHRHDLPGQRKGRAQL